MTEIPDPATPSTPVKKTPAKKAAKKTAAAPKDSEQKDVIERPSRAVPYLPALPEGFSYTTVVATGPNGESIAAEADSGGVVLSYTGTGDIRGVLGYGDMVEAAKGIAKAAKGMHEVAKREAELAKVRAEAFTL